MKCRTRCDEKEKVCGNCGNPLEVEVNPDSWPGSMEEGAEYGGSNEPDPAGPPGAGKEFFSTVSSEGEDIEKPIKGFLCPKCKIIYEHGNVCVGCGSPLEEHIPSAKEETLSPFVFEVEKKEPSAAYVPEATEVEPWPTFSPEVTEELSTKESIQLPALNQLQGDGTGPVAFLKEKQKRSFRLLLEVVSISVLVAAVGYLLWALSFNFSVKQPEANVPVPRQLDSKVQPPSSTGVDSPELVSKEMTGVKIDRSRDPSIVLPSGPEAEIQEMQNIRSLLGTIREANLGRNIDLFMSCYSPAFKDREGKKEETLQTWENFNYLDLSYHFKRHSISDHTAKARVEWRIKFSPKTGGPAQESQTVLNVTFKKEDDGWKIKEVEAVN